MTYQCLGCSVGSVYDAAREAGSTEGAARALQMANDLDVCLSGRFRLPVRVQNLRTGRHQKAAGAWSWTLLDADGTEILGSADTLRDTLAAHAGAQTALLDRDVSWTPEVVVDRSGARDHTRA